MSLTNSTLPAEPDITEPAQVYGQASQIVMAGMALHDQGATECTVVQSISAKLGKAKNTSIDRLPIELIQQVLSYLEEDIWQPSDINDEYPVLKTMRLANSAFNKVASPFLFRNVILYEHTKCYAALNSIANVPYLAPLVEGVQLAELGYLPDCCRDDEEKDESTHDCQTDEACGSFDHWQSFRTRTPVPFEAPAAGPMSKLDFSPEEMYKRYIAWRDGERTMKEYVRIGIVPSLDLHLLQDLRHIETVGFQKMRVIKRKWGKRLGMYRVFPSPSVWMLEFWIMFFEQMEGLRSRDVAQLSIKYVD